ncbi:hypothetical protein EV702DRAFT_1042503 [Suillus placidus]|uniref:Uncharacterized protein n=1 Tax=Suillus placidus TaxID=48579 RepID=A0A9P7D7I2_9AGAM|nr:hypothetical protein EV702DRAFT_1042503 [Suillus placidus]
MKSAKNEFFRMATLVQVVYEHLPLLSDVMALRNTCQATRDIASSCLAKRFGDIVKPFVASHTGEFKYLMHITPAVIVGSCTMKMLTGHSRSPRNLNIVVGNGGRHVWYCFIMDTLKYHRVHNTFPNYAYTQAVSSFALFQSGEYLITVTEASPAGLFNVVTTAPSTADMVFMSAGGLTVLYPEWTFKGTAVRNHSAVRTATGQNLGCIEQGGWSVEKDTGFLGMPCGSLCPMMWRNIAEHDQRTLVLQWDIRWSVTSLMKKSKTMWRLATQCRNPSCPFNTNANGHAPQLPATPMPDDLRSVQLQEERIAHHSPVSVLPTWSSEYSHSLSPALQMQICRHAVWHKGNLAPPGSHTSTSRGRKTYHVMADAVTDAPARGYTFFREHVMGFAPPNALIREVAGIDDHAEDVTGNVLVVKHAWKNKHKVVDCTTNDIEDINNVIKSCCRFWLMVVAKPPSLLRIAVTDTVNSLPDGDVSIVAVWGVQARVCNPYHVRAFNWGEYDKHLWKVSILMVTTGMIKTIANDVSVTIVFADSETLATYLVTEASKLDHAPYLSGSGKLMDLMMQQTEGV